MAGEIHSLESIPGLHKRLKIRALWAKVFGWRAEVLPSQKTHLIRFTFEKVKITLLASLIIYMLITAFFHFPLLMLKRNRDIIFVIL